MRRIFLNLGFYPCFFSMTLLFILLSLPIYLFYYIKENKNSPLALRQMIWLYGRKWVKLLSFFTSIKYAGFDNNIPSPCIIAPNHQSFFDPYFMGLWPHGNVVFVVRSWPFRIPFYGFCMRRAGY